MKRKGDPPDQLTFDIVEGRRLRDEGIGRAVRKAARTDPEWIIGARACLDMLARTSAEFTADDFWRWLPAYVPKQSLKRTKRDAAGAIFQRASRNGTIVQTGAFKQSARPEAHVKPLPVWRSLVYQPEAV